VADGDLIVGPSCKSPFATHNGYDLSLFEKLSKVEEIPKFFMLSVPHERGYVFFLLLIISWNCEE
jgi:hypothetical protein